MDCKTAREAISALLDGEGAGGQELERHLAGCPACRRWREGAHTVTRRIRLASARPVPSMPRRLVALTAAGTGMRRAGRDVRASRVALAAVGTAQFVWVAIPALLLGTDHDAPIHISHEMGSFDLAVAVGLLLAAWMPARAQGMRVLIGAAALLLMLTAVVDVARGSTTISDESPHLLVLAGWLLLRHLAKITPSGWGERRLALPGRLRRQPPHQGGRALVSDTGEQDLLAGAGLARGPGGVIHLPAAVFDAKTLHLGEFLPPLLAGGIYVPVYFKRALTLKRQGRPVPSWRIVSFVAAVATVVAIQLPPFDTIADEVLLAHMAQHIIIGEICSLFIVLGLTGAMLSPLLHVRFTRPLRVLTNPLIALGLWAVDLYTWHLPFFYQLAIRHDLVHALEHACLLWFGVLLWLALLGPLPKPAWYEGWGGVGYIFAVRCVGAVLGNFLLWTQTVLYPVYRESDAHRGLNPVSDQNLAGGLMDTVQIVLTVLLMCWLFMRWARRDEERQSLLDLAADRGVELSDERATRAAIAGTTEMLRERLLSHEEEEPLTEPKEQPVP